jgi:hypothetical protein
MAVYFPPFFGSNGRGALEPHFYDALLNRLQLHPDHIPDRMDPDKLSELHTLFASKFAEKKQHEWEAIFDGTDCCVTPVVQLSTDNNRPIAKLSDTPGLDVAIGQVEMLTAGTGGKEALQDWLKWKLGRDYTIDENGTTVITASAKL